MIMVLLNSLKLQQIGKTPIDSMLKSPHIPMLIKVHHQANLKSRKSTKMEELCMIEHLKATKQL